MTRFYSVILPDRHTGGEACYFIVYDHRTDAAVFESATYDNPADAQQAADDETNLHNLQYRRPTT